MFVVSELVAVVAIARVVAVRVDALAVLAAVAVRALVHVLARVAHLPVSVRTLAQVRADGVLAGVRARRLGRGALVHVAAVHAVLGQRVPVRTRAPVRSQRVVTAERAPRPPARALVYVHARLSNGYSLYIIYEQIRKVYIYSLQITIQLLSIWISVGLV